MMTTGCNRSGDVIVQGGGSVSGNPLTMLAETIQREIERTQTIRDVAVLEVPAQDSASDGRNALERLRERIAREAGVVGKNPATPNPKDSGFHTNSHQSDLNVESLVGREVLAILATQPLSAPARIEAIQQLVQVLDAPSKEGLREVLAILITGQQLR